MKKKILIIDDEADSLTYLSAILEENGFDPVTASDATAGFRLAQDEQPAVICLDIMMPRETGVSLLGQLKNDSLCRTIPILIISGVVRKDDFDKDGYLGELPGIAPDAILEKPIRVEEFVKTITELASQNQAVKGR